MDHDIDMVRIWLEARITEAFGYPSTVLVDCLMQQLVSKALYPYASAFKSLEKTGKDCFPTGTIIDCDSASIEVGSGRVLISTKQWIINIFGFFLRWMLCAVAILFPRKGTCSGMPSTLLYGVAEESLFDTEGDAHFVEYCRMGGIEPLREGRHFFVQSDTNHAPGNHPEFVYCKRPIVNILREANLGLYERVCLLVKHLWFFFVCVFSMLKHPALSLLGKELAFSKVVSILDKKDCLAAVIFTCSCYTNQPLWARSLLNTQTHMIWYAQNWKPVSFKSDGLSSDSPCLHWIRVDIHWVWTKAFATYLQTLVQQTTIKAVGPIVWRLPKFSLPPEDAIKITIFDISPFYDDIAIKFGQISNYNHPDNLFMFIRDILCLKLAIESAFNKPVSISLKNKRGYDPVYAREYFDYLNDLADQGAIRLEHYSMNIYTLISESHLVIAYPFTSPAYIAEALDVSSIYHDPTGSICRQDFSDTPLVCFTQSPSELTETAKQLLEVFSLSATNRSEKLSSDINLA
jgi:hypothetical protein